MKEHAEARVDPDFNPSDADIERAMVLITRAMLRMPAIQYNEKGNGNGNGTLYKWLMALLLVLLPMAIGGEVVVYGKVEAMSAKQDARYEATQQQLADIKKLVDIRFRGGMLGTPDAATSGP